MTEASDYRASRLTCRIVPRGLEVVAPKVDETVKSSKKDDFVKCSRYGVRILWNAAYLQYAAMTKDDA